MKLSRREFVKSASILAASPILSNNVAALPLGNGRTPGKANLNVSTPDLFNAQALINLLHASVFGPSGGATPDVLDADGYPLKNFNGSIESQLGYKNQTLSTTGPWKFKWPAGRASFRMNFQQGGKTVPGTAINCTINNGAGRGNYTVVGDGVHAGEVQINWINFSGLSAIFEGSRTYTGNYANNTGGEMALYRLSDEAAYNAGEYWTPEFIEFLRFLAPYSLRFMGANLPRNESVDSQESNWAYRSRTTDLSWSAKAFPPGARSGGTSSYADIPSSNGLYVAQPAADTSLTGWTAGEVLIGNNFSTTPAMSVTGTASGAGGNFQLLVSSTTGLTAGNPVQIAGVPNANGRWTILSVDSSTAFTINARYVGGYSGGGFIGYQRLRITGKSDGDKLILNNRGNAMSAGGSDQSSVASGYAVYVYDSVLDAVLFTSGGITLQPPIEAQAQLCKRVNAHFWYNFPSWANDGYVLGAANAAFNALNGSGLKFIAEYSNEVPWNFGFVATHWCIQRAAFLGIKDYYALRVRQINGDLLPSSLWGTSPLLDRYYSFQAAADTGTPGGGPNPGVSQSMSGLSLVGPGNAAYQALTGGKTYTAVGERPIDKCDSFGYAPYAAGYGWSGQSFDVGGVAPYAGVNDLHQIIIDYNEGNSAAVISAIDECIRGKTRAWVQTVTASGTAFTTPAPHQLKVGFCVKFDVTGGTTYSNLDTRQLYVVQSIPTPTTMTLRAIVNNVKGRSDIKTGSAGTGITTVGLCSYSENQDMFMLQTWYQQWENLAASFDASRASVSKPPLKVRQYEGALEPTAPTTAQCAAGFFASPAGVITTTGTIDGTKVVSAIPSTASLTVGMVVSGANIAPNTIISAIPNATSVTLNVAAYGSTVDGPIRFKGGLVASTAAQAASALAKALLLWKNDPAAAATLKEYYRQFMGLDPNHVTYGAMPHSETPAHLSILGGNLWSLCSGTTLTDTRPYELYNGFAAFSASDK